MSRRSGEVTADRPWAKDGRRSGARRSSRARPRRPILDASIAVEYYRSRRNPHYRNWLRRLAPRLGMPLRTWPTPGS